MQVYHRNIGVEVTPDMSINDLLREANLNWQVNISSIKYGGAEEYRTDEYIAAYRSDTGGLLDVYGSQRQPFQNRDVLEAFFDFCTTNNLQINRIGSLKSGRELFALAKLPIQLDVKNVGDISDIYLLINESHMCGRGFRIDLFFNRLICTNGMVAPVTVFGKAVTHNASFSKEKVKSVLNAALVKVAEEKEIKEKLADVPMSQEEAILHLINSFGVVGKPLVEQPKIVQTCLKLFNGQAKGANFLSAYNTAYGLLESVKEYINWHSPTRGSLETTFSSLCYGSRKQKQESFQKQLVQTYLN